MFLPLSLSQPFSYFSLLKFRYISPCCLFLFIPMDSDSVSSFYCVSLFVCPLSLSSFKYLSLSPPCPVPLSFPFFLLFMSSYFCPSLPASLFNPVLHFLPSVSAVFFVSSCRLLSFSLSFSSAVASALPHLRSLDFTLITKDEKETAVRTNYLRTLKQPKKRQGGTETNRDN